VDSLAELIIGHVAAQAPRTISAFYDTLLRIVIGSPHHLSSSSARLLSRILNSTHTHISQGLLLELANVLINVCEQSRTAVKIHSDAISTDVIDILSESETGLSILYASSNTNLWMRKEIQNQLLHLLQSSCCKEMLVYLVQSQEDIPTEIVRGLLKSNMTDVDSVTIRFLCLSIRNDVTTLARLLDPHERRYNPALIAKLKDAFKNTSAGMNIPPAIEVPRMPLVDLVMNSPRPDPLLSGDAQKVLSDIIPLSSSVQFKVKSAHLSTARQTNPSLFQSVQLFFAVYERVFTGSFNLAARRAIHGVFVHTLCSKEALDELDCISRQ
jgi:hypothetical protein